MQPVLTRLKLLQQLNEELARGHVLIAAPAGSGKTLLLGQLVQRRPDSHFVPLSPADVDRAVLLPRLEPFLKAGHTIVLDDAHHLLSGVEVAAWLQEKLAEETPRFLIAGRELPFEHSSLASNANVAVWPAARLALALEESRALLPAADRHQVASWHRLLEGWALGLGLLASLPPGTDPLPGLHERLFDYLAERVFAHLPASLRHYLTITAVPLRFNDELAAFLLPGQDVAALRRQVEGRSLFLYGDAEAGWFRYHELIRAYLLQSAGGELAPYTQAAIDWLHNQGASEAAIELALASGMTSIAVDLIAALPFLPLMQAGRFLTYRRWVRQLSASERRRHPILLARLGRYLHHVAGYQAEAWDHLQQARALVSEPTDTPVRHEVMRHVATVHAAEGQYDQAVAILETIVAEPACQDVDRLSLLNNLAVFEAYLARFASARAHFEEALQLALTLAHEAGARICRENLAALVLIPLGRLAEARSLLEASLQHYGDRRQGRLVLLTQLADLAMAEGNWAALAGAVEGARGILAQMEAPDRLLELLVGHYLAVLAIVEADYQRADTLLAELLHAADLDQHPIAWLLVHTAQVWSLCRQGAYEQAAELSTASLQARGQLPFYSARLALAGDIARAMRGLQAPGQPFTWSPGTRRLLAFRGRADLLRLRMAQTALCWRAGDGAWRRHARAALFGARHPAYDRLLTQRDPDLARQFWNILLLEGMAWQQTQKALQQVGQAQHITPLLAHEAPAVRSRAAQALASMRDERAMPPLLEAIEREAHLPARQTLQAALDELEALPPPRLRVQLLGGFRLWRGEQEIPARAFDRPVVVRLLQFFALHRDQPLPRDLILEQLWPDAAPGNAYKTFRSVYSRLNKALDPYMRANGPRRYFAGEGDVYRFDPAGRVTVDAESAAATVRQTLAASRGQAIPPLPDEFTATLSGWQPLLPELPYEEWLLEPRRALEQVYVDGCLYAGQALLAHDQAQEAVPWLERAVAAAPWREEAYRALMRAHARSGRPAQALRVYHEAVAALQEELALAPSDATRWLATRLQRGESI